MVRSEIQEATDELNELTVEADGRPQGARFCLQNPPLARKILKFAMCGALGQAHFFCKSMQEHESLDYLVPHFLKACIFYTIAHFDRDLAARSLWVNQRSI